MDTLYIGDIPTDYHFASYGNNYIDLYNVEQLQPDSTYNYYRIYLYDRGFFYEPRVNITTESYIGQTNNNINVSSSYVYRHDFVDICIICGLFIVCGLWFFNLISSCIRKGGLLGGLF